VTRPKLADGILTVRLPKATEAQTRKIEIKIRRNGPVVPAPRSF
jgi:hypothetical protein